MRQWEIDPPGCIYDTVGCTACGRCEPSPLDNWLEAKAADEADRRIDEYFASLPAPKTKVVYVAKRNR